MLFFSKMQATGNDFVVINNLENNIGYSYRLLSKFLCDRHYGVGADGILILVKGTKEKYRMRIFNSDGTEAEMCGNGIRCFAKYLYEKKLIDKLEFKIETLAGAKEIHLKVEGDTVIDVEVNMGEPIFEFKKIPVYYYEEMSNNNNDNSDNKNTVSNISTNSKNVICSDFKSIKIKKYECFPVSMGNPHCVCFCENIDKINVKKIGSMIENYKYFPNKTNVEFVKVIDEKNIDLRVWERGAKETLACGTGACAAAIISNLHKFTDNEVEVHLKGGNLKVKYENKKAILSGTAEFVYEGSMKI